MKKHSFSRGENEKLATAAREKKGTGALLARARKEVFPGGKKSCGPRGDTSTLGTAVYVWGGEREGKQWGKRVEVKLHVPEKTRLLPI